jgi:hypothetical protein
VVCTAVVGGGITLSEVVGLDLGGVATEPLPVDLVEVIGLQNEAGDNTGTGRGSDGDVNLAEEDVLGARDGRGVALVLDGEDGTELVVVGQGSTIGKGEEVVLALGEVDGGGAS